MASQPRTVVGVISDTHGLLRPEAIAALHGSDLIVHAGDVGDPEILDQLREIAPTFAVRGNVDTSSWAQALPLTEVVEAGACSAMSSTTCSISAWIPKPRDLPSSFPATPIVRMCKYDTMCCT
jgi:hypothetical protein